MLSNNNNTQNDFELPKSQLTDWVFPDTLLTKEQLIPLHTSHMKLPMCKSVGTPHDPYGFTNASSPEYFMTYATEQPNAVSFLHDWWTTEQLLSLTEGDAFANLVGNSFAFFQYLALEQQKSIFFFVIIFIVLIVCMLVAVAYYTLAERKVMAFMQRRRGPNVVGFWGLLQPLADGMKLLFKEIIVPRKANLYLFLFAPVLTFILSLVSWSVMPLTQTFVLADVPLGIIFLLAISSLGVYGIIIAGWASNSNYAFLGALRSTAQMISYEITISFVVLTVMFYVGSYNLTDIVAAQYNCWFIYPLLPIALIFFICMLAETNRAPFDLPEAEAELVAGYNVDYSSITFALFFLGEYANMLLMSGLMVILFFGGWFAPFAFLDWINSSFIFALKLVFFAFAFIWVRATLPRYRYDQLMTLGWKIFLPFTFGFFLLLFGFFFAVGIFPEIYHLAPQAIADEPYASEFSAVLNESRPFTFGPHGPKAPLEIYAPQFSKVACFTGDCSAPALDCSTGKCLPVATSCSTGDCIPPQTPCSTGNCPTGNIVEEVVPVKSVEKEVVKQKCPMPFIG